MTATILPIAVLIAAIALTYLFCIRPMRRGTCGMAAQPDDAQQRRDEEIRALHQEIKELRRTSSTQHRHSG